MKIQFTNFREYLYFERILQEEKVTITKARRKKDYILDVSNIPRKKVSRAIIKLYWMLRFPRQVKNIIQSIYFYQDEVEIEQIIAWTYWLMRDEASSQLFYYQANMNQQLTSLFQKHSPHQLDDYQIFHFDTFVLFQLKSFHDQLVELVGLAIDEMKMEEEHQHYINRLRIYLQRRRPKCKKLYILQGNPPRYFTEKGKLHNRKHIGLMAKKEPLYILGIKGLDFSLIPVLTLLPESIKIYGTNPDEDYIVTLFKLYEERVSFFDFKEFPFPV